MRRRAVLHALVLLPFASACDRKEAKGSSDDDGASARKDRKDRKKKDEADEEEEEGVVAAPKPGQEPALRVGSWAKYRMPTGEATWGLLEKRGDDEWLVDAKVAGRMPIAVQAWVRVSDLRDRRSIEVRSLRAKIGNGPIQTFPTAAGTPVSALFDKFMSASAPPKFEGLPQEDVKVEAAEFRGCYKWSNKLTLMGMTVDETVWTHPAVPLPSIVKSADAKGEGMELIAYGLDGAKPSL